jgi:hypothetical protein
MAAVLAPWWRLAAWFRRPLLGQAYHQRQAMLDSYAQAPPT